MKIVASSPHFFVTDLMKSVRFYVDVLGFDEPEIWGDPPCFAMPARDGFIVMLNQCEGHDPSPNGPRDCWDAYFWVDQIGDFLEIARDKGADIVHGLENRPFYGMREIGLRDPDGYMLVFAEDMGEAR